MTSERGTVVAWLVFFTVAVGVLGSGLDRDTEAQLAQRASTGALEPLDVVRAARLLYTSDGDLWRYRAYANAALGRPYRPYFVRPAASWRDEFAVGGAAEADRDAGSEVTPRQPLVPYREFAVEYPPALFGLTIPIAAATTSETEFRVAFATAMALAIALALRLVLRGTRQLIPELPPRRVIAAATACVWLLGVVVTHRMDAVVGLLVTAAVVGALEDRPLGAGAALGAAIAVKLVPVLVVPVVAAAWVHERRWSRLARFAGACAIATAVGLAPFALFGGDGVAAMLRYHAERPLEVESTWGALLRLVDGSGVHVETTFGSRNFVGDDAATVLRVVPIALATGLGAVAILVWRRLRAAASRVEVCVIVARAALAVLVAYMVLNKVFSPQYLVWILPLGVLVSALDGRRSLVVLGLVLAMTQVIYPIGAPSLQSGAAWTAALVVARNALLAVWALAPLVTARASSRRLRPG